ncbi:hypothetical protein BS47DRAFT_785761 [Hydnum rufescens UP504]|uniref:Uncharacterized protein n=1 Tax=Hydnum rufescens UP504 TaxID=1448309 RepID=A0A9P6DYZ3_9AGAM|nr:hypothetical protein BS47DRAFT_785761 [Hydnum rufescens UP504]
MLTNDFPDAGPSHDLSSSQKTWLQHIHITSHHEQCEAPYTPLPFLLQRCRSCHIRANMHPKVTPLPQDLLIRLSTHQYVLTHSQNAPSFSTHAAESMPHIYESSSTSDSCSTPSIHLVIHIVALRSQNLPAIWPAPYPDSPTINFLLPSTIP